MGFPTSNWSIVRGKVGRGKTKEEIECFVIEGWKGVNLIVGRGKVKGRS
jgi:hypothetical protein